MADQTLPNPSGDISALPSAVAPDPSAEQVATDIVAPIEKQLESLQDEISSLQQEVVALRRRDESLKFYMHRVDEEMRLAARLQQDFLPKHLPQVGRIFFHTIFRPAGYVSGDLYDVMRLDEKHVGFYMADAVGHGMPAALLTMFIKNALVTKQITPGGYRLLNPSETMAHLNEALVGQHLSHATFATAIYGYVNTETLEATFARGGHPCPILVRANGEVESLDADGSLLGIFEEEIFANRTVQLGVGDRLFIFTDGVECAFSTNPTTPDPHQWREELCRRCSLSTDQVVSELIQHIDSEAGSLAPKDDLTIIVIEVK